MVLVCLAAFLIVVGLTRYVSVGSLVVVTIYLIEIVFYGQQGGFGVPEGALWEMYAIAALLLDVYKRQMMSRVYNFSAGPAVLPEAVLQEAADDM